MDQNGGGPSGFAPKRQGYLQQHGGVPFGFPVNPGDTDIMGHGYPEKNTHSLPRVWDIECQHASSTHRGIRKHHDQLGQCNVRSHGRTVGTTFGWPLGHLRRELQQALPTLTLPVHSLQRPGAPLREHVFVCGQLLLDLLARETKEEKVICPADVLLCRP